MPKDREKYRYIDVGLERGSWALVMFEEDARRHHMSDQPGKLIALRLTEYYEWKKERETLSSKEPRMDPGSRNASMLHSNEQSRSNGVTQNQEDTILEISQQAGENADEAAEYWARL
jgi:hypothetical protein